MASSRRWISCVDDTKKVIHMFKLINLSFLLLIITPLYVYSLSTFEDGILPLHISDAAGNSVSNIIITCQEGCSSAISDSQGIARLALPKQKHPGDWVTLKIVNS